MHDSKKCFKCGETKVLEEFYKHPMMADGHLGKCKECNKKDVCENRSKNIDYYRAYDLERSKTPERILASRLMTNSWRRRDKRINAAHSAVARAVKSGALKRLPCERCGNQKSMAHHDSYNHKLDVIWLCQPCHKQRHKELVLMDLDPLF